MRTAVSAHAGPRRPVRPSSCWPSWPTCRTCPIEVPGLLPAGSTGRVACSCSRPASSSPASRSATTSSSGRTGLLSFGHALFVAAGSYLLTISLSDVGAPSARGRPRLVGHDDAARPRRRRRSRYESGDRLRHGDPRLRPGGVDHRDAQPRRPDRRRGGRALNRRRCPTCSSEWPTRPTATGWPSASWWSPGVVVTLLVRSRAGHAMAAVRENEARAAVLGLDTYRVKLLAIVVGAVLGGLGGIVHALVLGGSNPHLTTTEFTLALLVMVVLGGAGSMWGAARRLPLPLCRRPARRAERRGLPRTRCRTSCSRSCPSRSSSSGCSSSSSSTSHRRA